MKPVQKSMLLALSLFPIASSVPGFAQNVTPGVKPITIEISMATRRRLVVVSGTAQYGANIWVTNTVTGKTVFRRIYGMQNEGYCALALSAAAAEAGLNPKNLGANVVEMDGNLSINVQGFVFKDA